ncbi:MAG: GDP-L-fucose synthase [Desulfonauticus sp.]|nr:GDP-L-fucose synthase [Desulfonauticus sp.]
MSDNKPNTINHSPSANHQAPSTILVTGGTGLVGSGLIKKLLSKGYKNILSTYHSRKPIAGQVNFVQCDLREQKQVDKLFDVYRPEYVFLAAAKVGGILANNTYKAEFIYDNLAIALNVIHSAYKYGVKKLLNLGSSCIYPKNCPQPMKEEHLLTSSLEPTNEPYAIAKISAIKLVRYYNEQYDTNFISVMPTNLYGPGDNFNLETSHVLPAFIRKFHLAKMLQENNWDGLLKDLKTYPIGFGLDDKIDWKKESVLKALEKVGIFAKGLDVKVVLWGSGGVYREFLHVDDLADACVFLIENVEAEDMRKLSPDFFVNVGTGEDIKLRNLALLVKETVGFKGEIVWDSSRPEGVARKLLDIKKITSLGWRPKINLEQGIRVFYSYYCSYVNQRG